MANYTQAGRPFRVYTPLGDDVLLLENVEGEESISRPLNTAPNMPRHEQCDPPGWTLVNKTDSRRDRLPKRHSCYPRCGEPLLSRGYPMGATA
jgi:hypothetical protein